MFTEIAARLFHMFRKSDMDTDGTLTVTLSFSNSRTRYNFEKNIKLELQSYMLYSSNGNIFNLDEFEFEGIKWSLKVDESLSRRSYEGHTRV